MTNILRSIKNITLINFSKEYYHKLNFSFTCIEIKIGSIINLIKVLN